MIVVFASALITSTASAWPGPPKGAPPAQPKGPPAAWAETKRDSTWLAYSSYCWSRRNHDGRTALCVDMVPAESRHDLPILRVRLGETVRVHFAFTPTHAHVTTFEALRFTHVSVSPNRVVHWPVRKFGIVSIDVTAPAGQAAYLVRLVPESQP